MKMNRYHKRFLESYASENIIALFSRYKNAAKEITESFAMLQAAKGIDIDLDQCWVVVVGDGASPRTGAFFAYYTKAKVISVDPQANIKHWREHCEKQNNMGYPPERLLFLRKKIEDVLIDCEGNPVMVVWPHSHADMNKTEISNYSKRFDIAMPCCAKIPPNWMAKPHVTYTDFNVLSPKRDVHIWEQDGDIKSD